MKNSAVLKEELRQGKHSALFQDIYLDESLLEYQNRRYAEAVAKFEELFGEKEVEIYSAPGRSEVGGNHTDHQLGMVLATSINLDAIAVVSRTEGNLIRVVSEGYDMVEVDIEDLEEKAYEEGTTIALIRGVAANLKERGYKLGGFEAYITSDVLIGAGLSSSAAFEVIIGTILSGLFNDMSISPVLIAQAGQFAENVYFGKPSGLMDQMACSVGGFITIDFADPEKPVVEKVDFDFARSGYKLCIVDTGGNHADLTADITESICIDTFLGVGGEVRQQRGARRGHRDGEEIHHDVRYVHINHLDYAAEVRHRKRHDTYDGKWRTEP